MEDDKNRGIRTTLRGGKVLKPALGEAKGSSSTGPIIVKVHS